MDGAVSSGKVLVRVRVEIATVTTTAAANSRICSVMVSSLKTAQSEATPSPPQRDREPPQLAAS